MDWERLTKNQRLVIQALKQDVQKEIAENRYLRKHINRMNDMFVQQSEEILQLQAIIGELQGEGLP